jgi:type I restriction enzyme, R subunit
MAEVVVPFESENTQSLLDEMNIAALLEAKGSGNSDPDHMFFLVKRFKDIKIEIFAKEHPPPHFRVKTNAGTGNFSIVNCEPLDCASAILRRHREIKRWYSQNRQLLIDTWNSTRPSDCPVGEFRD